MTMGFRKGFFYAFIRSIGWILALILSFLLHSPFSGFVKTNTGLYDWIYIDVFERISASVSIPVGLGDVSSYADDLIISTTENISNAVFTVLTFLILLIFTKLILFLLTLLFSKQNTDGVIGGVDGFLGLLVGGVTGIIVVLILLAFISPFAFMISPDAYQAVLTWLDNSYIAGLLYEYNPLLYFLDGFIPEIPDFDSIDSIDPDSLPEGVNPEDVDPEDIDSEDIPESLRKDYENLI